MNNGDKPRRNPFVMLREEFDDWAVLFNPDTGRGFGLNPTGVYVWKLFDGEHSIEDLLNALRCDATGVPQDAGAHMVAFVEELTHHGLVTYEEKRYLRIGHSVKPPCDTSMPRGNTDAMKIAYETPKLINLSGEPAHGDCANGSGNTSFKCYNGANTTVPCYNGNVAVGYCETGTSPSSGCQYCYQGCSVTSWRGCSACSCGTQPGVCNTGDSAAYGCNPVGNSGG